VSSEKNETITDAGGDGQVDIRVEPAISRPAGRGERHGSNTSSPIPSKTQSHQAHFTGAGAPSGGRSQPVSGQQTSGFVPERRYRTPGYNTSRSLRGNCRPGAHNRGPANRRRIGPPVCAPWIIERELAVVHRKRIPPGAWPERHDSVGGILQQGAGLKLFEMEADPRHGQLPRPKRRKNFGQIHYHHGDMLGTRQCGARQVSNSSGSASYENQRPVYGLCI
jgi:hypothetical protein